jgi:hypothetical protein
VSTVNKEVNYNCNLRNVILHCGNILNKDDGKREADNGL